MLTNAEGKTVVVLTQLLLKNVHIYVYVPLDKYVLLRENQRKVDET